LPGQRGTVCPLQLPKRALPSGKTPIRADSSSLWLLFVINLLFKAVRYTKFLECERKYNSYIVEYFVMRGGIEAKPAKKNTENTLNHYVNRNIYLAS
jgi:hypothetical protein